MKFILSTLLALFSLLAIAHEVPHRKGGGSITFASEGLRSRRGELVPPKEIFGQEEMNKVLFKDLTIQNNELKKVKYYLVNGETALARAYLSKLAYTQTKLRPVVFRYLATLSFIQNDFEKTYEYLSLPELQNIPHYGKICVLKVITEIVLSHRDLEKDWNKCQQENHGRFRDKNLLWLDTLVQLKIDPKRGITEIPFEKFKIAALETEDAKVMMKLALYLNQEHLVRDEISKLSVEQMQDPEVRELAGQIFFRSGSLAKAYRFVEDLKSPNSENIKGNLYLLRKKYELAYPQFKLALEQKLNSQNALERLLPLAWMLGDWKGGRKYAEQITARPETKFNKLALKAAFTMQEGEYEQASAILRYIAEKSGRGTELEVTQLASFTALMQNKPDVVRKQANLSCEQYDLVNCWILFQMDQWDNFPLTILRDEKILEKKEWEKLSTDSVNHPLKESVYVNQIDIEEMDDKLIQLIPQT